jgi:hypothetical protein
MVISVCSITGHRVLAGVCNYLLPVPVLVPFALSKCLTGLSSLPGKVPQTSLCTAYIWPAAGLPGTT